MILLIIGKYSFYSSYKQAREFIGNGFKGFVEKIHTKPTDKNRRSLYNEFLDIYSEHFLQQTVPYDGALEFLKTTQMPISLCTNKPERFALETLKHYEVYNLNWQGLVYGDSFKQAKPHPQGVEHLYMLSNIEKENTILIGDGLPDALAAKNAGIKFIGVDFGYHPAEELRRWGAKHVISSFAELSALDLSQI